MAQIYAPLADNVKRGIRTHARSRSESDVSLSQSRRKRMLPFRFSRRPSVSRSKNAVSATDADDREPLLSANSDEQQASVAQPADNIAAAKDKKKKHKRKEKDKKKEKSKRKHSKATRKAAAAVLPVPNDGTDDGAAPLAVVTAGPASPRTMLTRKGTRHNIHNPESTRHSHDKAQRVQDELHRVKNTVRKTLDSVMARGDQLERLEQTADELVAVNDEFTGNTRKLRRTLCRKRCRRIALLVGCGTAVLLAVLLAFYVTFCGWTLDIGKCLAPPPPPPP
jgi:hypothetical protein